MSNKESKHSRFAVSGMTCAACSSRIERVVGRMDGVDEVSVNLAAETMRIEFDPSKQSEASIAESVKLLGFKAEPMREGGSRDIVLDVA
ncbi:MAG: cation transporter, partial [Oceanidesulfovibrio sp.]